MTFNAKHKDTPRPEDRTGPSAPGRRPRATHGDVPQALLAGSVRVLRASCGERKRAAEDCARTGSSPGTAPTAPRTGALRKPSAAVSHGAGAAAHRPAEATRSAADALFGTKVDSQASAPGRSPRHPRETPAPTCARGSSQHCSSRGPKGHAAMAGGHGDQRVPGRSVPTPYGKLALCREHPCAPKLFAKMTRKQLL